MGEKTKKAKGSIRKPKTPEEIERHRIAKMNSHPLRVDILRAIDRGGTPMSPNQLAQMFDESLNLVAYHVRVLEKECAALILVDTKARRGATEHFYSTTATVRHPIRDAILGALIRADHPLSSAQLARELSQPLERIKFHVGVLENSGAIEVARTTERPGADQPEEFYASTGTMEPAPGLHLTPAMRELLIDLVDDHGLKNGYDADQRATLIEARKQLVLTSESYV